MRFKRRLTALVLAALAVFSLASAPVSAAPVAVDPISYIHNSVQSSVGVGVIHTWHDGGALYDAILPVNRRTDRHLNWQQAEGIYVGPGWCAYTAFQYEGNEYLYHRAARGSVYLPRDTTTTDSDGVTRWVVIIYPCS